MLLSIVLEHLIPHTESLMTVVASSAANKTINLKFEIMARVSDVQGSTVPNQRKIVLSLQKKFKSQTSAMEVLIDKDEDKTIAQIRAGIKAERKQYISVRPSTTAVQNNPSAVPANATQLIDVNKFIDQQVIYNPISNYLMGTCYITDISLLVLIRLLYICSAWKTRYTGTVWMQYKSLECI